MTTAKRAAEIFVKASNKSSCISPKEGLSVSLIEVLISLQSDSKDDSTGFSEEQWKVFGGDYGQVPQEILSDMEKKFSFLCAYVDECFYEGKTDADFIKEHIEFQFPVKCL